MDHFTAVKRIETEKDFVDYAIKKAGPGMPFQIIERESLDKFHREEGLAFAVRVVIENFQQVRVAESRHHLEFLPERLIGEEIDLRAGTGVFQGADFVLNGILHLVNRPESAGSGGF